MSEFDTMEAIRAVLGIKPACQGMKRAEITSLLNRELVRLKLERRNAYSYWAHEVEVWDERKGSTTWVDFMLFEPGGYHTATRPGNIEAGKFTCFEVKSCLEDIKSGHGLNFYGDENYLVMPCEVYPKFKDAWHGTLKGNFKDQDKKLHECVPTLSSFEFMLYGTGRNGYASFKVNEDHILRRPRTKPASELLLCMMRAMIANSGRSDVSHAVVREVE